MPPKRPDSRRPAGPRRDSRPAGRGPKREATASRTPSRPQETAPAKAPSEASAGPARARPAATFTTFEGEEVEIGSSWKRLVAAELQRRRIRWRYRAFDFPITDRHGREVLWTPDFFIYDEAPKLVRVIAVKGTDADTLVDRARLFKQQYPGIAVEVWGREKLVELGLLAGGARPGGSRGTKRSR